MSQTYTSAAEDAARIRAEYKAFGWGRREISVRSSEFSMGSSVDVRILSPKVDVAKATEIARRIAESIRRDERSGEILSGGNRYVEVRPPPTGPRNPGVL